VGTAYPVSTTPSTVPPAKSVQARRPSKPSPPCAADYYSEWVKGNSVANLVKKKLSASSEGRRLQQLRAKEDERRVLLFVRRMGEGERDEYFDALGDDDPVYKKLRWTGQSSDVDMDELL
jgi:hypothetical protein